MAAYNPIQRASCGYWLGTVLGERVHDGSDATACTVMAQRQGQRHDGPCDVFRGVGRVALGSCGPFLSPGRMVCIRAIPPRVEPTFRAGQLPTAVLDGVFGTILVDGLLTSLCLALGQKRYLWELMVSVPWHHVFSMSWHNRWRVPGPIRMVMMASLCTHHALRRPCQGNRSESQCLITRTAQGERPRRSWACNDAVFDRMLRVADQVHPLAVQ
jgi:hypothetical protein